MPDPLDRSIGCLLGLAVGDALGTTLEFQPPGTFEPIGDVVGGGPFGLEAGQWTDDTSMALCLAESLLECRGFDAADQMRRYVRWWREGHWSSTGECFDIGNTTSAALRRFEETGEPFAGSDDARSAGNGSLMRLAPVAIYYAPEKGAAREAANNSSRTTHGAMEAVAACGFFAEVLVDALAGKSKGDLLRDRGGNSMLPAKIAVIAGAQSYARKEPPDIRGTGYVVDCLEAALWAFHKSTNFRDGALLAVNLGDDADTTGAVYGQIAGAHYGASGIPEEWRAKIHRRVDIEGLARRLQDPALGPDTPGFETGPRTIA
ncbi:MAG: ADP-ribosylglycohydrolase family protein [Planctomycetota bacterium]|jgi:ADP-ribosylglycohydrolase